jgi:hypothetical protein
VYSEGYGYLLSGFSALLSSSVKDEIPEGMLILAELGAETASTPSEYHASAIVRAVELLATFTNTTLSFSETTKALAAIDTTQFTLLNSVSDAQRTHVGKVSNR